MTAHPRPRANHQLCPLIMTYRFEDKLPSIQLTSSQRILIEERLARARHLVAEWVEAGRPARRVGVADFAWSAREHSFSAMGEPAGRADAQRSPDSPAPAFAVTVVEPSLHGDPKPCTQNHPAPTPDAIV